MFEKLFLLLVNIAENTGKVQFNFHLTFASLMKNPFCKCYLNITFEWKQCASILRIY